MENTWLVELYEGGSVVDAIRTTSLMLAARAGQWFRDSRYYDQTGRHVVITHGAMIDGEFICDRTNDGFFRWDGF